MNRRVVIIAGIILVLLVGIYVSVRPSTAPAANAGSAEFTDAITGQTATDIVQQDSGLAPDELSKANVSITGIDKLYTYFTNEQAFSAQTAINDYLLARSGLGDIQAGVVNSVMTQSDTDVQFDIETLRPQGHFHVTVRVTSSIQTSADVTIRQTS